jgi:hypothetical protein
LHGIFLGVSTKKYSTFIFFSIKKYNGTDEDTCFFCIGVKAFSLLMECYFQFQQKGKNHSGSLGDCCLIVLKCKKTLFWLADATEGLQDVVHNSASASSIVLNQVVDFMG